MENKILFWFSVIFVATVPIFIGIKFVNVKMAAVSVLCGALLLVASKIEIIKEFSMGPLKAKMKETIQEANATIEQLKTVSVASAKATLTSLMAKNFWGGVSRKAQLDLHDQIIESLKKVGFSNQEINEADEMWNRGIGMIYLNKVSSLIAEIRKSNPTNSPAHAEAQKTQKDFQDLLDFENWKVPSPDKMTSFLKERGFLKPEMEEWIADHRHFLNTGEIRRRDLFAQQE